MYCHHHQRVELIALILEVVHTSETSVDIQLRTRQYIPEDSELHPAFHYIWLSATKFLIRVQ
jgi:hypothetical protein